MRRTSDRFLSSRELDAAQAWNQRDARSSDGNGHDQPDDPTSEWPPHRRTSNCPLVRSPETAAPRHRMAWMLAHAPEYNRWGENNDADQAALRRLRLDSPDAPTWRRPTESSRHYATELPTPMAPRDYASGDSLLDGLTHESHHRPERGRGPSYFTELVEDVHAQDQARKEPAENQERETSRKREDELVSDGDGDGSEGEADPETKAEPNVPKTSRYLREMDRRVILDRLAQGEKQATLAKEFNVSRAAISNLFKHREAILARTDEDPHAKHPKKKKRKTKLRQEKQRARSLQDALDTPFDRRSGTTDSTTIQSSLDTASSTLVMARGRAFPLLLSTMSNSTRSLAEFRRTAERALWLLLEEALATIPIEAAQTEYDPFGDVENVIARFPSCAISMEQDALDATPMLDIFQLMEPRRPLGIANIQTHEDAVTVEIQDSGLPRSLREHNVFVLDVVAASGEGVCVTIERLLREYDAVEANIAVVALFSSSEVVAMVQCTYPQAKIVTARIDSSITRRRIASTPVDLILHRMRQAYSY